MIPASTSTGKKIALAIVFLIVCATGLIFLFSSRNINDTPAATPQPAVHKSISPDSASLIYHLAFLTSPETAGRETGTPGNAIARKYIENIFDSLQLLKTGDSYLQPFTFGRDSIKGNNVVGLIKGTHYPNSYIVLSAHYDHLGIRNGNIYFGADDNASGTACLLALVQYFKKHPPMHSLVFAAFDAEEKGLRGSYHFVEHCPVPLTSVMMNLNMDMISRNDNNEIYACGIFHYPFMKKYVDSIKNISTVKVLYGHDDPAKGSSQDWTSQSDHFAFHKQKIPFLYFGVEDHPDYHKPGDTFDKVNKSFYYRICTMIAETVLLLDKQESLQ